jgi:hypothetical protein
MSVPGSVAEVRAAAIEVLHGTATIIEVIGMGVIVAGSVVAAVSFVRSGGSQCWGMAFQQLRANSDARSCWGSGSWSPRTSSEPW